MTRPESTHPADQLRDHLHTIRSLWADTIPAARSTSVSIWRAKGGRTSNPKDADNSDRDTDVTRLDSALSTRADILAVLNGWTRILIEDYELTQTCVDGHDVHALCETLDRWASQLVNHEAWEVMLDEIRDCAQQIHRIARPTRRDWLIIGQCPIVNDETGQPCGGNVRAWPDPARDRDPRCTRCGTEAVTDWWMSHMIGDPASRPLVTTTELIGVIAYRLHWTVTHEQIRQWAARGKIERAGKDIKGRTLFDHQAVVDAILGDVSSWREKVGG